ncbi:hypothetical protein C2869_12555 [Saccharobesus litoralis]|uniref:Uncharacterized protein n=1 Tax=Saccharobesus litoralis TaxID=2172099 RepID=A0A2S0VSL8_9ALTE|nr:DUF58 domain-containing protein [Saccharobesus litoralis]AWB67216.1 hypothetical protein C2869_12555 [Saccharobesus litoralis]
MFKIQAKPRFLSRFLNKRLPAKRRHELNYNTLFILPSRAGVAVILVAFAIYVMGTNYANNLVLLLAYIVTALLISAIFYSFFNLSRLQIQIEASQPIYLGQKLQQHFRVTNQRAAYAVEFLYAKQQLEFDLPEPGSHTVSFDYMPEQRGWFEPDRLRISSQAPFMLYTVWSLPQFAIRQLVYPKPLACPEWLAGTGQDDSDEGEANQKSHDVNDFYGLREYVATDPLKHVAWKHLAKGKGWLTKQFSGQESELKWFSYRLIYSHCASQNTQLTGNELHEMTLSKLTWLVQQAHLGQAVFGLQLPNQSFPPDQGEQHLERCLKALALSEVGL